MEHWRFLQDDELTVDAALSMDGTNWARVDLPHSWNTHDASSTVQTTPSSKLYKRGHGWYRLKFEQLRPQTNAWLQFNAASMVADVWLNGQKLGEHRGAFTAFRFDVTSLLKLGANELLVHVDNTAPLKGQDRTAIAPLSGDFNISGGLYRGVSLIMTPARAYIALDDSGSPGIQVRTRHVARNHDASLSIQVKLGNKLAQAERYTVQLQLLDGRGKRVSAMQQSITLKPGLHSEVSSNLTVPRARLWQGTEDPFLYNLVVALRDSHGQQIDTSTVQVGVREMRFDPDQGFFLNGRHVPLHGVNLHQDWQEKGWALTDADIDRSMSIIREMGANAVRLAHYPHSQHTYDMADRLGLIVWAETPFVDRSLTPADCRSGAAIPTAFQENLEQQTREMVRQLYNHPSIATWSVGNELAMGGICKGKDTVTPLLRRLNVVVKEGDPFRATTLADMHEEPDGDSTKPAHLATGGITDIWGSNRYPMWYDSGNRASILALFHNLHIKHPTQPMGVSEYGAGAALTHQTDNPRGGMVASMDTSGRTRTVYQPEGYASHVHEQVYGALASLPFIWGTFAWNMFDFGSGTRHEGDVGGVNTKGLVTFDRQIRKDPFYFYQANWSAEPVTHLADKRYSKRAYRFADVKVYSNADRINLLVNGHVVMTKSAVECPMRTCDFKNIELKPGENEVVALGTHKKKQVRDAARWRLDTDNARNLYLLAGQATTGFMSSDGHRYGSDNFFEGGTGTLLMGAPYGVQYYARATNVPDARDAALWEAVRYGKFSYRLPLANGDYEVALGFLEPDRKVKLGDRVFDVRANGTTRIANLDIMAVAEGSSKAIRRSFDVTVTNGVLQLDFLPIVGDAVLSNIVIRSRLEQP